VVGGDTGGGFGSALQEDLPVVLAAGKTLKRAQTALRRDVATVDGQHAVPLALRLFFRRVRELVGSDDLGVVADVEPFRSEHEVQPSTTAAAGADEVDPEHGIVAGFGGLHCADFVNVAGASDSG
jgi:hypothetical protein